MNEVCKRVVDLVFSVMGLTVCAPLMAVIAMALWIEAPGEVIFVQERIGQYGKRFRLYKFRKFAPEVGTTGRGVTVARDARMTALGRLLERTKFDELPQLWNILRGEMSFVGPRPETPRFAQLFEGEFSRVLDFKPGIFGPNQVAFRNESSMYPADEDPEAFYRRKLFPAKARNDLAYFSRATCLGNMGWIIRGIWVSVVGVLPWRRLASLHWLSVTLDWSAAALAWSLAWAFRYGWTAQPDWSLFRAGLLVFPPVLWGSLLVAGSYAHPIRSFSLSDAGRLLLASLVGWLVAFLVLLGWFDRSASILLAPLGWLMAVPVLVAPRVVRRILAERARIQSRAKKMARRVLIVGADRLGELMKEWAVADLPDVEVVGFVDDSPRLQGKRVRGLPVLGRGMDLPAIQERFDLDELWLTVPVSEPLREMAREMDLLVVDILRNLPFAVPKRPFRGHPEPENLDLPVGGRARLLREVGCASTEQSIQEVQPDLRL